MAYSHCSYDNDDTWSSIGDGYDYDWILEPQQRENHGESSSLIGLTLRKTPSFLDRIDKLSLGNNRDDNGSSSSFQQPMGCQKIKASNFDATLLRIGSWQRVRRFPGDLVAKFYYAKRKLVWEVLDGALKSKIEINWSDISAIRAVFPENHPGILELELCNPPKFQEEIKPVPGRHTQWKDSEDFTGKQATIYRSHYLQFPEGTLENHYQKILQCDTRLHMLSQRPFPSSNSAVFAEYTQDVYTDFSGHQHPRTPQGTSSVRLMDQGFGNPAIQQPMHMAPFFDQTTTHENVYQGQTPPYCSYMNLHYNIPLHDSSAEIPNELAGPSELFDIVNHLLDEQTATTVDPSSEQHPGLLARMKSLDDCLLQLPSPVVQNQTHDKTCSDFSCEDTGSFVEPYTSKPEFMVHPFLPAPPIEGRQYPTNFQPQIGDLQYHINVPRKPF